MVCANHLVSVCDIGFRAEEKRAVVAHVFEEVARIASHDFDVFVGEPVGFLNRFREISHHNNLTVIAPGDGGNLCGRKSLELPLDLRRKGSRQSL